MPLNDNATVLPGRGTILLHNTPGTVFDEDMLDALDLDATTPALPSGWTWLGHTSRENNVALSKSGGEVTTKGSWWNAALRGSKTPTEWGVTVNSLQIDADTLALAFPGGALNATTGVFEIPETESLVDRAALIYIQDGTRHMGIWFSKLACSLGEPPSIDVENFLEIQIAGTALAVAGKRMGIIPPRPIPA